ncbi:MAG: LCP family protein [Minisyncoccota bacterium]
MDSLHKKYKSAKRLVTSSRVQTRTATPLTIHQETSRTPQKIHTRRRRWSHIWSIFFWVFLCVGIVLIGTLGFYMIKSLTIGRSIQMENHNSVSFLTDIKRFTASYLKKNHPLVGEEEGRINILLLGRAGEHYPGKNLTDTLIVMSIDTRQKKVSLLSLPRDLYVPIPHTDLSTKINALYQYGLSQNTGADLLRTSVETITGQPIQYFFILDFDGFEKAINVLGGIHVDVLRDFYDPRYPGKNYSYETFEIKKGWKTLDGATTLKYVRERHNDPEGDFGRAKRQQQVIQAVKDRAFSVGTFLNIFAVNNLLNILGESVKTNMSLEDMESFLELARSLDTENISSVVIDAWKRESLLRVSHIQVGTASAFILVPRVGNWSEIQEISENIFRLDALALRQKQIADEQPSMTIVYASDHLSVAKKIQTLATEQMTFASVNLIPFNTLEKAPKQSMLIDRSNLSKPYSLDTLLKKFTLHHGETAPFTFPTSPTDFILFLGDDIVENLNFEEVQADTITNDTSFSEPLPPQKNVTRKSY